ncbi:histone acetyltransferase 1 [Sporothrix brasiliensis 5110]|uniref:Histone acetyltransferase type B catalytic subunit n=1 Tax=Sporothrix brasiliensis 5110 TaxID=1398154 RepID=A0A0C2FUQ8_9PEZI|nr:histone acetyltransferase 1 [Sporothrix brasiliensis 5110]KIH94748.1 histone acetyltransferase 1 [Sporothrix brasiliensis 5110]
MEHSYDEWVSNATEALEISLVQPAPTGLRSIASFNPKFTYSIFGDEETVVGYQGLKISLRFNASDMRPNLQVTSTKKLKTGEIEPTDIRTVLKGYLVDVAFQKLSEFEQAIKQTPGANYTPPGERIRTFVGNDGRYEIWKGTLSDPAVLQLVKRVEIFVPFFIEGGTFIAKEDATSHTVDSADRWSIFFLYRTRQLPGSADLYEHEFAGYSTVYRFLLPVGPATPPRQKAATTTGDADAFALPPSDDEGHQTTSFALAKLPCRSRISQFIILPPFQGKGNAGRLYSAIFDEYLNEPQTTEITVEDPNEAFDDLRDIADLAYVSKLPAFTDAVHVNKAVKIPRTGPSPRNIVDTAALETLRHTTKIAPRQFNRVVEMYLMQKLAPAVRPTLEEEEEENGEDDGGDEDAGGKGKSVAAAVAVANSKGKSAAAALPPATAEQEHEYKLWRLFVKQRLYRHNKEILGQLERSQRIDKLEETLVSVELEYARILSMFESRSKLAADQQVSVKRKLSAEDEKEVAAVQNSSKRARVEDA